MIIDSTRMQNIRLAVSLIGTLPGASKQFEVNQTREWARQMLILADELERNNA